MPFNCPKDTKKIKKTMGLSPLKPHQGSNPDT